MKHLKIFIDLTRLNKPIGYMLLFWPCSWGLAYTNILKSNNEIFFYYLFLFFLGSILMRSAGCIFNDIVDRNFDKKVKRTKKRPLAAAKISVAHAFVYVIILCLLALIVLLQFNNLTIALGLGSMFLAFSYPYMKRITYWPQLFLGLTFNWGLIMAWASINNNISLEIIILYTSAIFWTLGYDTIYGAQDMSDDEIIGLKSTSIKFKKNAKKFLSFNYAGFLFLFLVGGYYMKLNYIYFLILLIPFLHLFFYQISKFQIYNAFQSLKIFKSNNILGLIIFLNILIPKIIQ